MKGLWLAATACVLLAVGCGSGAAGGGEAADPPKAKAALTLAQYLDLKTDALTADKLDWKKGMEIARKVVEAEPDGAKTYQVNMPLQWFNAEHDVLIYAYRRADDRTLAKSAPNRGFAVVLNASTGGVILAGAYRR